MRSDVVVVGGGVAGLAAAGRLVSAGRTVTLVEAKSRLGGRVWTEILPHSTQPVELGAEFVQRESSELIELVRSGGLRLVEVPDQHEYMRGGDERPFPDPEALVGRLLKLSRSEDVPVAQLIRQQQAHFTPRELQALTDYLQGFHAADLERFGTRALAENQEVEEASSSQFRLEEGYGALLDQLISRIGTPERLWTNAMVTRIRWRAGEAVVEAITSQGRTEIVASQVIVTIPLGVLKTAEGEEGSISLQPYPPDWADAIARLHVGDARRVVVQFDNAWWIERGRPAPVFMHGRDEPLPVWWTASPPEAPFLTGWVGGPRAGALRGASCDELAGSAVQSLSRIFGRSVSSLEASLKAAYSHDWSDDPFARGAYSYGGVGAARAVHLLSKPVGNTLFLAGEALAGLGHNATVSGALTSGYAAATAVLKQSVASSAH